MFSRLETLVTRVIINIFQLDLTTHLGAAVHFFLYDSIKIFLLLVIIIHLMTLVNHYLPVTKIRTFLTSRKRYGADHLFGSFFGAITPFCTCSSIPLFVGFLKAGIPLGVTLSFLITSPLINEVAIALFLGIFGIKVTLYYLLAGIILGTVGGWILGKMGLEIQIADFIRTGIPTQQKKQADNLHVQSESFFLIYKKVQRESWKLIRKIIPYVLVGIGVGAAIHGFVPSGYFESYLQEGSVLGVPLAVLLGVPLYSNASGVIPIVQSLIAKGVPLGTGLAFMMAVVGLSLPEFLILKKVMKPKLLFTFFGFIALCMITIGYIFNAFL